MAFFTSSSSQSVPYLTFTPKYLLGAPIGLHPSPASNIINA